MKTIRGLSVLATAGLLSMGSLGHAAPDGATLYEAKFCLGCHGADARTPILPEYPKLAGQNADYALNQMQSIKSGARNNGQAAVMQGIMETVSDEEMRAIADWLSTL